MKCPFCENDMELGFIQCRDGITWTPKKQVISSLSFLGKGAQVIENGASDDSKAVYAYRCKECKKIIIDYFYNENN